MEKADGIVKKYFKDLKYFKATWLVKVTWENMTLYAHKEQVNILFAKGLRSSLIIVTTKKEVIKVNLLLLYGLFFGQNILILKDALKGFTI